jgi:hypothetical protein
MKVICIDGIKAGHPSQTIRGFEPANKHDEIYEGEVYTVIREHICFGELAYILLERSYLNSYRKNRFAPLSDIDETEFVRDYNKQEA